MLFGVGVGGGCRILRGTLAVLFRLSRALAVPLMRHQG